MRSRILALLLVLAIVPVSGEVVELAVHWVTEGDVAHVAGDAHDTAPLGADEHGCSGLFHLCACHTAQATPAPAVAAAAHPAPACGRVVARAPLPDRGRGAPPPTIRPPIA